MSDDARELLRRLRDALPRCEYPGCSRPATRVGHDGRHGHYNQCDEHGGGFRIVELPHAATLRVVDAFLARGRPAAKNQDIPISDALWVLQQWRRSNMPPPEVRIALDRLERAAFDAMSAAPPPPEPTLDPVTQGAMARVVEAWKTLNGDITKIATPQYRERYGDRGYEGVEVAGPTLLTVTHRDDHWREVERGIAALDAILRGESQVPDDRPRRRPISRTTRDFMQPSRDGLVRIEIAHLGLLPGAVIHVEGAGRYEVIATAATGFLGDAISARRSSALMAPDDAFGGDMVEEGSVVSIELPDAAVTQP
jgi:hypothetical protein